MWIILCVHKAVCEDTVVHQMLVYKRLGDFRGPLFVFTNMVLKARLCSRRLCSRCLYTSVWAIFVDHSLCSSRGSGRHGCAPDACIQSSRRFPWTVVCVHEHGSQGTVVQQMFVHKRLGDFRGPLYRLTSILLWMHVESKCAHGQDAST